MLTNLVWDHWRSLSEAIGECFPIAKYQGADVVRNPLDSVNGALNNDGLQIEKLLEGKIWRDFILDLLRPQDLSSILYWMSPRAKAYFLPAFLVVAGVVDRSITEVAAFTVDMLIPVSAESVRESLCSDKGATFQIQSEFEVFVGALSTRQRLAVVDFLKLEISRNVKDGSSEYGIALNQLLIEWKHLAN